MVKKIAAVELEEVKRKVSTTDSRGFTYSAQTICDKHGFVF